MRRRRQPVHGDRALAADRRRRGRDPGRRPGRRGRRRATRWSEWRAERDEAAVRRRAGGAARAWRPTDENVMPATIAAARAGVTTGEWAQALREAFGSYRAPTGVGEAAAPRPPARRWPSCATRWRASSEALGRTLKILVGKPGPRRALQRRRADRRARARRGHGGRLRGHPAHAGADRALGGGRGRPRDRPVDPVGLAPRADPGRDRGAARGGRRRHPGRGRRHHPRRPTSSR